MPSDHWKDLKMPATDNTLLYDRPPSVSSGKSLDHNLVIQRRSDVLLEEQMENIRNIQDALQRMLTNLDHAKHKEEKDFYRSQADELKQRCEEMMLVLKIITKINTELTYARIGLKRALQTGSNINIARKRVNWLEDKMEHLLGKDKQRRPSRAQMKSVTGGDQTVMLNESRKYEDDRCSGSRGISDFSSMGAPDFSNDSSAPPSRQKTSILSTHSSQMEQGRLLPLDLTMDVPSLGLGSYSSQQYNQVGIEKGDMETGTDIAGLSDTKRKWSTVDSKLQPVSETQDWMSSSSSSTSSSSLSSSLSSSSSSSSSTSSLASLPPVLTVQDRKGSSKLSTQPTNISEMEEKEDESRKEEESEINEDESGPHHSTEKTDISYHDLETAHVFLTEDYDELQISRNDTSQRSRGSHVTLKTPAEAQEIYDSAEETRSIDETTKYWNSEHHRFEFSEYTDVLLSINPLSYHQMGLAVRGTFVDDVEGDPTLPWRPQDNKKAGGEVVDIHKQALDKLSLKVHKMYNRVKEASLLSVEGYKEKEFGAPTLFQDSPVGDESYTGDSEADLIPRENTVESSQKPGTSKTTVILPGSKEPVTFPPLEKNRIGSSFSGRLVYYPKPLPFPEKLPLTRVNVSKKLPPSDDLYSDSVPGKDPPPERFVNQRNLYKETKFTSSLFRSKHNKQKKPTGIHHQYQPVEPCQTPSPIMKGLLSLKSTFKMAATTVKLGRGMGKWKDMKPKSGFLDHSGLKWERVKNIVHNSLESTNVEERVDAARHLGVLKCADAMVNYALRVRLREDPEQRVVYESVKALILLGCWDEEAVEKLVQFLRNGNTEIRMDLLKAINKGKNVHYIDKRMKSFSTLTKIISILCMHPDPEDELSFQAAICLGKMCVVDSNAVAKLRMVMESTTKTHDRAQALTILIHQMNEHDPITVKAVMDQLRHSPVWKYRKEAAKHLIIIGARHVKRNGQVEEMFELLFRRLWDEPNKEVRQEVAKALAAQDLFATACEKVERCLSDNDENIRAEAVISIGTLGMKAERIIRSLLEMMELDGSDYVRLLILRTFGVLNCTDRRVMRLLRDKEKGDGPLAREAKRVLECLTNSLRNGNYNKTKKMKCD